MLAAYTNDRLPIRAVVNIYGPGDLRRLFEDPPSPDPLRVRGKLTALLGGGAVEKTTAYVDASPSSFVRAGLPPTLHIQGGADHVIPAEQTRELHGLLLARGSRSLLLELPWADHSFDFVFFGPGASLAEIAIEAFLA
jgi:dipeptidyl aminopeptidase/acylaminoacyl peptidase